MLSQVVRHSYCSISDRESFSSKLNTPRELENYGHWSWCVRQWPWRYVYRRRRRAQIFFRCQGRLFKGYTTYTGISFRGDAELP